MIPHICILIPSLFSLYQSLYLSHSNLSLTFFCCKRYCFYSLSLSLTWPPSPPPPTQTTQAYNCLTITGLFFLCCRLRFFLNSLWSGPNPLFCDVYRSAVNLLKASNHKPSLFLFAFPPQSHHSSTPPPQSYSLNSLNHDLLSSYFLPYSSLPCLPFYFYF